MYSRAYFNEVCETKNHDKTADLLNYLFHDLLASRGGSGNRVSNVGDFGKNLADKLSNPSVFETKDWEKWINNVYLF